MALHLSLRASICIIKPESQKDCQSSSRYVRCVRLHSFASQYPCLYLALAYGSTNMRRWARSACAYQTTSTTVPSPLNMSLSGARYIYLAPGASGRSCIQPNNSDKVIPPPLHILTSIPLTVRPPLHHSTATLTTYRQHVYQRNSRHLHRAQWHGLHLVRLWHPELHYSTLPRPTQRLRLPCITTTQRPPNRPLRHCRHTPSRPRLEIPHMGLHVRDDSRLHRRNHRLRRPHNHVPKPVEQLGLHHANRPHHHWPRFLQRSHLRRTLPNRQLPLTQILSLQPRLLLLHLHPLRHHLADPPGRWWRYVLDFQRRLDIWR